MRRGAIHQRRPFKREEVGGGRGGQLIFSSFFSTIFIGRKAHRTQTVPVSAFPKQITERGNFTRKTIKQLKI